MVARRAFDGDGFEITRPDTGCLARGSRFRRAYRFVIPKAFSAKTEINSLPIIFRLRSGSVTPSNWERKRSVASTPITLRPMALAKHFQVCSNSFLRSMPVFTKIFVRRSPIARCTRTAATVESTPPLRAQITRDWPTFCRTATVVSSMKAAPLHFGSALQTRNKKLRRISRTAIGVLNASG